MESNSSSILWLIMHVWNTVSEKEKGQYIFVEMLHQAVE